VGIGSTADSLAALKYHVFDKKTISAKDMLKVLNENYSGYDELRDQLVNHTPKYGNDNDYVDEIMREVFNMFFNAVDGRAAGHYGKHHILMLPTTSHVYFGSVINALPDGRKAGKPLSEGISPVQGADKNGPTSVIKSAAKMDHIRTGGTLLNQKFIPQILKDDEGITKLLHLIRSYFRMDGHHMQFNVIDANTLRKAQKNPEQYRSLIVRVAGYSDYFVDLTEELQNEIIQRTQHESL
jgi:formate C-acetyltransferase